MEQAAGFILLGLAGVIVWNLAMGGPNQAKQWLYAKFLGRP